MPTSELEDETCQAPFPHFASAVKSQDLGGGTADQTWRWRKTQNLRKGREPCLPGPLSSPTCPSASFPSFPPSGVHLGIDELLLVTSGLRERNKELGDLTNRQHLAHTIEAAAVYSPF